ncbi:MAG: putative oxidoreductase C-terminal domain-containing protein, partial [Gemmata sp.]
MRLMTLAPGHFHAALVQKRALHGVHPRTYVYAPLDNDTLNHLSRIASFNNRRERPTSWEVDLRAGPDYLDRFAREQPGNTVILSGRNRPKIDLMHLAVSNCLSVVADKPWIIDHADFPKLEALFKEADLRDVLVWDVLTERFEVTNWLQREFTRDADLFGAWQAGSAAHPALWLKSVHYLKKVVNGQPLVRPWWWFDRDLSGEAMADVGTHLADLSLWLVAPDQAVDYATQVQMLAAERAPLLLTPEQYSAVTLTRAIPAELARYTAGGQLYYAGHNTATYALRGVHVKLETSWEYDSEGHSDTHHSVARGTRATVSVRQTPGAQPELFVAATNPAEHAAVLTRLRGRCESLQRDFAGLSVEDCGAEARVLIPESWHATHEDHFAAVMDEFIRYFHTPRAVPSWERPNTLARYYITTKAVEMA